MFSYSKMWGLVGYNLDVKKMVNYVDPEFIMRLIFLLGPNGYYLFNFSGNFGLIWMIIEC